MEGIGLFVKACQFASEKHKEQRRKNKLGTPYINHPLEVANYISEVGKIYDVVPLVSAVLHDTVEDTDTTYEELVTVFGKEIADVVMEVTDDKSLPKVTRKKLQVEHAKVISDNAKLVKMCDKISNVKSTVLDPPSWSDEMCIGYGVWSKAVVDNMATDTDTGRVSINSSIDKEFNYWLDKLLEKYGASENSDFDKLLSEYYDSMS
jgi:guanosine-3',5'-bis(diphosphate) 3'-pyrophosphohydrolase